MKVRLTNPTFDASAQTITHPSFSDVTLAGIQLIVNVTDQVIIYNFADTTKGGTLSTDTLTLEYDTTTMSDTDELMVLVEDGIPYSTNEATVNAHLQAIEDALGSIELDASSILAAVDGLEGLLTTIDADTAQIAAATQEQGSVYTPSRISIGGGVRQDAAGSPSGVADGDVHPFVFNEEGRLKVSAQPAIYSATTGNITANGQTVSVDVSRASNLMIHMTTSSLSNHNVTFEGSLDGGTTWVATQVVRTNANTVELTSGTLAATPAYGWEASVNAFTHFRVRATAHTSGTATWRFLPGAYATEPIPAIQTHAVTGSGNFAVTMAANATTTPAKARDGVAGGTDTGIPNLFIRRDTPTAVTPIAGDWEIPQISANGEQWVRLAGELADDAAFTVGTTRVVPTGFLADETATDSVDEGDAGIARITLDRKQITTPYVHAAAGGWTPYKNLDVDESEDEIKATAGKLGFIHVMNMSASVRYLKLYNATAASVTVGTTTPTLTFPIPTFASTNGAGFTINFGDAGLQFSTAITVAATTGFADNDTGAPGANEVIFNCGYL